MYRFPPFNPSSGRRCDFPTGSIFNDDSLEIIKKLPAASVDCIITDPPSGYDAQRTKREF